MHAIDLANKKANVLAGVPQGHFEEVPLVQDPLQMLLLHALGDGSVAMVLVVPSMFATSIP